MSCIILPISKFQRFIQRLSIVLFGTFLSGLVIANDTELEQINAIYQSVLDDYVSPGRKNGLSANMVDYAAVKKDPRLPELQARLQKFPKETLDSREKKIAFYLNAYNILAIAKVTQHWPLFKLKSMGSYFKPVWTHPVGEVCGDAMTLRKLEHEILRKLGEPRIHFALNCASMSCPDLRKEPYLESRIEQQLSEQTQAFLSQSGKGMAIEDNQLKLSSIFNWFEEDFEASGGVLDFILPYLPEDPPHGSKPWKISGYLTYDWSVNDTLSGAERMKIKRGSGTWFN